MHRKHFTSNGRVEDEPRLVRFFKGVNRCYSRVYHQLEVVSPCRLPRSGPAILVCNHVSALDPALVQSVCPRLIIWMMASEYYALPQLRWFYQLMQTIPVDRSGRDLAATRKALRALDAGHVLGVFPEGRIETDHELLPFQTGVAMMALKTGVGVYPTYLDGTHRGVAMVQAWTNSQKARISFGGRVELGPVGGHRPDLGSATKVLEMAVFRLRQGLSGPGVEENREDFATSGGE